MALLMMDGFEHLPYMKSGWVWGNETPIAAPGRSATGKAISFPTYSTGDLIYTLGVNATTTIVGVAFNFRDSSLFGGTNASSFLVAFNGDAGETRHLSVGVNSSGLLTVRRGTPSGSLLATQSGSAPIQPGVWYFLEIKVSVADSGGSVTARLNDTQIISYTGDTKNGGTLSSVSHVRLSGYGFIQYDDMYIMDDLGTSFNDFIGDFSIKSIKPVEDGDTNNFIGTDNDNFDNYLLVSDDDPSTYVSSGISTEQELYYYDVETTDTIKAVQPVALGKLSEVGSKKVKFIGKSSASTPHDDASEQSLSTSWTVVAGEVHPLDIDGDAWDATELSQSQFGIEVV